MCSWFCNLGRVRQDNSSPLHVLSGVATQPELETAYRWLTHMAGKSVLAIRWEPRQGCQPGASLLLHTWLLGLPPAWRLRSQREEVKAASPFKTKAQDWQCCFHLFNWSIPSHAPPRFNGGMMMEERRRCGSGLGWRSKGGKGPGEWCSSLYSPCEGVWISLYV